jgi:hypothetical protein
LLPLRGNYSSEAFLGSYAHPSAWMSFAAAHAVDT